MRTVKIPTIAGDVMFVEVPKETGEVDLKWTSPTMDRSGTVMLVEKVGGGRKYICHVGIEKDNPQILGTIDADTCTVENCERFVEKKKSSWGTSFYFDYVNNPTGKPKHEGFDSPTDSFRSLLQANGVVFNSGEKWVVILTNSKIASP